MKNVNMKKYRIRECKFFPILKGFEGIKFGETTYNGQLFYRLQATNQGPVMNGKIRAWKEGDIRTNLASELERVSR